MKQQSLIGLIASFAVLGSSSIFQSKASAEPHRIFNTLLPQLERRTRVPILLPRELPQLLLQRSNSFYLHLEKANANGYEISILTDPNCRGANVCFLGSLSAERISSTAAYASPSSVRELQSQANVSLRGGIKGFFEPLSCGGSCSPPNLRWVYQGVLYEISLRTSNENSDTQRSILVAMASSSLPETSQPTVARSPSSGQQTGAGGLIQTQSIRSETVGNLGLERVILEQIPKEFVKNTRYYYNRIDLNGDNIPEVIVQIVGHGVCGSGGCSTFIYKIVGQSYQLVSEIAQTGGPVIVTAQKSYGWNDLIVRSGSVLEPGYRLMRFNGRSYPASPADGLPIPKNSTIIGRAFLSDANSTGGIALRPIGSENTVGRSQSSGQQIAAGRSPSSGQQMGTGRVSTPRQVYRNVRELGMAQFLGGNRELIAIIQQEFKLATQGQYQTINIPKAEFLEKKITDRMGSGCVPLAPCPDEKKISYADYLKLKLKLDTQAKLYNEHGVNIFEAINKYKSRLERERLYGGQSVASKLVSLQSEANQQVQRQRQQRDSRVSSVENIVALAKDASLQNVILVGTGAKFNFDIAPAAIRVYLRSQGINVSQLENTILPGLGNASQLRDNVDYVVKVGEILPKAFEAFLKGNDNELRNVVLEIGSETVALVKSDRWSGGLGITPHAAKAIESYQKIEQLEKLREDLDRLRILDERDKSYIDWTMKSLQWDLISSVVSVLEDIFKSAGLGNHPLLVEIDNYHKASDSIKSAFSNASDAASQQKLRRDYQVLLTEYEKNQIVILAFSSFVDSAAEEVGRYLVSVRTDVVTRRSDGTITVSTDGVLYPP